MFRDFWLKVHDIVHFGLQPFGVSTVTKTGPQFPTDSQLGYDSLTIHS